jgi:chaperonin GroEL
MGYANPIHRMGYAVFAKAAAEAGVDGVITVEESQTFGLQVEVVEGMQFDKGYIKEPVGIYFVVESKDFTEVEKEVMRKIIADIKNKRNR